MIVLYYLDDIDDIIDRHLSIQRRRRRDLLLSCVLAISRQISLRRRFTYYVVVDRIRYNRSNYIYVDIDNRVYLLYSRIYRIYYNT